ncbi:MAG: hypothetical protein U0174_17415 [Polyangiaceae bacterium]
MKTFTIACLVGLMVACGGANDDLLDDPNGEDNGGNPNDPNKPNLDPNGNDPAKICREVQAGNKFVGLAGANLAAGRVDGLEVKNVPVPQDRHRVLPHSSMVAEFQRVLGTSNNMTQLINNSGGDFAAPPARWFLEPQSGAVPLFTAYRAAFKGCLDLNNQTAAVSLEAAKTECATLQAKAWRRTPTTDEIDSCAAIAATPANFTGLTDAQGNAITFTNPQKWAYACASVLSSAEFLAY